MAKIMRNGRDYSAPVAGSGPVWELYDKTAESILLPIDDESTILTDNVSICQPPECVGRFTFRGVAPTLSYRAYAGGGDMDINTKSIGDVSLSNSPDNSDGLAFVPETFANVAGINFISLGSSADKWDKIYAKTSVITTSDEDMKRDIKNLDGELASKLIMGLTPISYKLADGQSGRTHYGLGSRAVEALMGSLGMEGTDFAGFCKDRRKVKKFDENGLCLYQDVLGEDGEPVYDYALRYEEFIPLVIKMEQTLYRLSIEQSEEIRRQSEEIRRQAETIRELSCRLEAIEQRPNQSSGEIAGPGRLTPSV